LLLEVTGPAYACGYIVSSARGLLSLGAIGGFIGGIAGALRATDYNAQFRSYLDRYMLKTLNVRSGEIKTRLIFVPKKSFHSPFELSLTQLIKENDTVKRQPLVFHVKI